MQKRKVAFFDRDGVLNHLVRREGSYYSPQKFNEFTIVRPLLGFVKKVKSKGYLTICISNQPDIKRLRMEIDELDKMTKELMDNYKFDDILYCLHDDDDDCSCRKPKIGLFQKAVLKWNIDLKKSFYVGDTWRDEEAGKNLGLTTFMIPSTREKQEYQNLINHLHKISSFI